jgi:serine/threonine protein kinase
MDSSRQLAPGSSLGPYRIEALAGEGAMGRVYRATDSRLNRAVALKLLPADVVGSRADFSRFETEAKAASALNHPNIVTVYEVGELLDASGRSAPFLSMEFVEGQSLRDILSSGLLPIKKVLDLAIQASEGLMRAHEAGITHRDLKPDNMMVRSDGYLKILDFGLAHRTPDGENDSERPTLDGRYLVAGTASYMSPEQARGKSLDGRSDIFSLGVVLYELLSGRAPFAAENTVDTLSLILHSPPPSLSDVAPHVPRDLSRTVERCLEKAPDERFQSMRDLQLELKAIRRDFESGLIPTSTQKLLARPASRAGGARLFAWLATAALLAAAVIAVSRLSAPTAPARVVNLTSSGMASSPAISPDGTLAAYLEASSPPRLKVARLGGEASLLVDTAGSLPSSPVFSHDGIDLYFAGVLPGEERSIFRVSALGGTPRKLLAGYRPRPSPDGLRLAFLRDVPGAHPSFSLCVSGPLGEEPRCVRAGPAPDELFGFDWANDSRSIHFVRGVAGREASELGVFDAAKFSFRPADSTPGVLPLLVNGFARDPVSEDLFLTGSRVYGRGGDLCRLRGGTLSSLTSGVSDFRGLSVDLAGEKAVAANFRENSSILSISLTGAASADTRGAKTLTNPNEGDYRPVWSPDGSRIAFTSTRTGHRSLWVMSSEGKDLRELTPGADDYGWPAWSPDGESLSFAWNRTGNHEIYVRAVAGGEARRLTTSNVFNGQSWWTPDGKWIYYESANAGGSPVLKRVASSGGEPEVIANEDDEFPTISPDGNFIAVTSEPESAGEIPVFVLRRSDGKRIFSSSSSSAAHLLTWTPDSRAIVAVRPAQGRSGQNVYRIPIDGAPAVALTDFSPDIRLSGCALDSSGAKLLVARQKDNSDIVLISPLQRPSLWKRLAGSFGK